METHFCNQIGGNIKEHWKIRKVVDDNADDCGNNDDNDDNDYDGNYDLAVDYDDNNHHCDDGHDYCDDG